MLKRAGGPTRTRRRLAVFALTVGCLAAARAATAQETGGVTVEVGECTELPSPEERLACYEARVDAELKRRESAPRAAAAESPAAAAAESPAASVPEAAAAESPAASVPEAAAAESPAAAAPPAQTADSDAPKADRSRRADAERLEIVGTVAALKETVPNALMITLEDGQVWRQTYPERYPLRVGQRVTLRSTRWGDSFRLTAEGLSGYGFIQVERVR